jgi:hypothetical protein
MCTCPSEFYKWLRVFKVVGGNPQLSYGEMVITNNVRPTGGVIYPTPNWQKVEAGNPSAPITPPDYSLYGPGDLNNWSFDATSARLVYTGNSSGYFQVKVSLSVCMDSGTTTFIKFALRKNNDITTDNELFLKSQMPLTAREGLSQGAIVNADSVTLQGVDFFTTNDYVDLIVQNNATPSRPIVAQMNFVVSSLGDAQSDVDANFIITNTGAFIANNNGDLLIANE